MASTFLKYDKPIIPPEERKWARRAHLTTLLTYPFALIPLSFSWIVPAVGVFPFSIWASRKKDSFSARQALEAIYLQVILSLGYVGFGAAFAEDRVLLVFSYIFMTLLHLGLLGYGLIRVSLGRNHNYPFSFIPALFRKKLTEDQWKLAREKLAKKEDFTEFKTSLHNLEESIRTIESHIDDLGDPELRSKGRQVKDSLDLLRESLLAKPENYRMVRQFLNYFPETTTDLLGKYNHLDRQNSTLDSMSSEESNSREERKTNLQKLLAEINQTSMEVRRKILSSENMALDAEISAMKKNIEYGGY